MHSENEPMTLVGKKLRSPSPQKTWKGYAYRTKARISQVDETLFGSPARFSQQVETKHAVHGSEWDPPWSTGPNSKGAPLLWTPFNYTNFQGELSPTNVASPKPKPILKSSPSPLNSQQKYRLKNHMPTFVDETLFGPNMTIAGSASVLAKDSSGSDASNTPSVPLDSNESGPSCTLGVYNDPGIPPTPRDATYLAGNSRANLLGQQPVIHSRPGSNIKTAKKNSYPQNVSKKLYFSDEDDKDEMIEKALRLAKQSREAMPGANMLNSPRNPRWRQRPQSARTAGHSPRPASTSSGHHAPSSKQPPYAQPYRPIAHISDYTTPRDEHLMTGLLATRIPLSARSDGSHRPASSRSSVSNRPGSARRSRPCTPDTHAVRSAWK